VGIFGICRSIFRSFRDSPIVAWVLSRATDREDYGANQFLLLEILRG